MKSLSSDGLRGLYADRAYAIEDVEDFRDIVAATSEELRTWKDGLDARYRISSVSSRVGTGAVQFNAVALQEENPHEYHLLIELDDEAAKKTFDRLHHEEGFRLVGSCGTLKDGRELPWRSTQLWVKDGQTQKHWYGWMETIVEGNVEGKSTKFRPTYMAGRASPKGLGCNSVLAPDQGRAWDAFYSLDSNELLGTIEFYRWKGWRPDVVSPYWDNGKLQYMLVVLENPDGVDWRFRMDMTIDDYKRESAEQRKLGLFPHSLTSQGEGVHTRYEALFVRFRKRSKE